MTDLTPHASALPQPLRRGLLWSALAAAGVAVLAGGLALAVAWKAGGERLRLQESLLARARAEMAGAEPGRTERALAAVREAAAQQATAPLRDVAIAALTAPDLVVRDFFPVLSEASGAVSMAAGGRFFSRQLDGDGLEICELETGRRIHALTGFGEEPHLTVMNAEGSLIAVRLAGGALRVFSLTENGVPVETYRAAHRRTQTSRHSLAFVPGHADLLLMADQEAQTVSLRRVSAGHADAPDLLAWQLDSTPGALAVSADARRAAIAIGGGRVAVTALPDLSGSGPFAAGALEILAGPSRATALAFRPQGDVLGAACAEGEAWLADLQTQRLYPWKAHRGYANGVLFHPSGAWMVTTGWDGRTCVWEGQTGQALLASRSGLAETFSPDGTQLVFYVGQQGFGRWEARTGAPALALFGLPPLVRMELDDAALSPDGTRIAAANREGFAVWDAQSGRRLAWVPRPGCRGVAFSPDGTALLVSGDAGAAMWRGAGEQLEPVTFQGGPLAPLHRLTSSGGAVAVSGTGTGWLLQWQGAVAVPRLRVSHGIFTEETRLALDPGNRRAAASLWKGGGTLLWDGADPMTEPLRIEERGGNAVFAPHSGELITASNAGYQFRRAPRWTEPVQQIPETSGSDLPGDAVFAGKELALVSGRSGVVLLNADTRRPLLRLEAPPGGQIYRLAADVSGQRLAAATDLGLVSLWRRDVLDSGLAALGFAAGPLPSSLEGSALAAAPRWALLAAVAALAAMLAALWLHRRQREALRRYESARASLLHAEKMRALGVVSTGIAHDFRNLLSIVSLNSGLLRQRMESASAGEAPLDAVSAAEAAEEFDAIEHAVRDGGAVVRSLLGFAREQDGRAAAAAGQPPAACDTGEEVENLVAMLGKRFLAGLRLHLQIESSLPPAAVPAPALHQMLLNLVMNATEAMNDRGDLTISAHRSETAPAGTRLLPPPDGPAILLTVSDTGPGIVPADHHRIFEPFFTTKAQSTRAGTGLGLYTVLEIAARHRAGLLLRSASGEGAAFLLELPALPG